MEEYKCAFSNTLVTNQFGCEQGEPVARRGGPDVVCKSHDAHRRCAMLFMQMKSAALPAFGVEDDLLTMPHSVLGKIQFGGLLGLQQLIDPGSDIQERVTNIYALTKTAFARYERLQGLPLDRIMQAIVSFQGRRKSNRPLKPSS